MSTADGGSCLMLVCLEIGRGMKMDVKPQGKTAYVNPKRRELGLKRGLHKLGSYYWFVHMPFHNHSL